MNISNYKSISPLKHTIEANKTYYNNLKTVNLNSNLDEELFNKTIHVNTKISGKKKNYFINNTGSGNMDFFFEWKKNNTQNKEKNKYNQSTVFNNKVRKRKSKYMMSNHTKGKDMASTKNKISAEHDTGYISVYKTNTLNMNERSVMNKQNNSNSASNVIETLKSATPISDMSFIFLPKIKLFNKKNQNDKLKVSLKKVVNNKISLKSLSKEIVSAKKIR
jgi:hypothetical protein